MSGPLDPSRATRTAVLEPSTPPSPSAPPTARRTAWLVAGVIVAIAALAIGGSVFAYAQYRAPRDAATQFCTDLKTQRYGLAYDLFSAKAQVRFPRAQFVRDAQELDQLEGKVAACGPASTNGTYRYRLGSSTAAVATVITRTTIGPLHGVLQLQHEARAWKIDGLNTSLLGVSLGALETAQAFCQAMQSQAYLTAYGLLDNAAQAALTPNAFIEAAQAHDQIDGTITACALVGLGDGNSDSNASLIVSINRARSAQRTGAVTLDAEGGVWKIAALSPELQGTDLGPLQVGARMCADLVSGAYAAIYDLTSAAFQANVTRAQVVAFFTLPSGLRYSGCKPDLSSYRVVGSNASYSVQINLIVTVSGSVLSFPFTLYFVDEAGGWKLDGIFLNQGTAGRSMRPGTGSVSTSLIQVLAAV